MQSMGKAFWPSFQGVACSYRSTLFDRLEATISIILCRTMNKDQIEILVEMEPQFDILHTAIEPEFRDV